MLENCFTKERDERKGISRVSLAFHVIERSEMEKVKESMVGDIDGINK